MEKVKSALSNLEAVFAEFQDTVKAGSLDSEDRHGAAMALIEHALAKLYFKVVMDQVEDRFSGAEREHEQLERLKGYFAQLAEAKKESRAGRKGIAREHLLKVAEALGYAVE